MALGALIWNQPGRLDAPIPTLESPDLAGAPTKPSTLTIPFDVPLNTIAAAMETSVPISQSDNQVRELCLDPLVDGICMDVSADWTASRGEFRISQYKDGIVIESDIHGNADGILMPEVSVEGTIRTYLQPELTTDWRLKLNLNPSLTLNDATMTFFGRSKVSVRTIVEEPLERILRGSLDRFEDELMLDDSIEGFIKQQFDQICRSFPVYENKAWLHVKPIAVRWKNPEIENETIRFQIGIDAETSITDQNNAPQCFFPSEVVLEDFRPGAFEMILPLQFGYESIGLVLTELFSGKEFGTEISITIDQVKVYPNRDVVVFALSFTKKRGSSIFDFGANGTIYVMSKPSLDSERNRIIFGDISLDIESENMLLSTFSSIGSSAFNLVTNEEFIFDYSSQIQEIIDKVNQALSMISTSTFVVDSNVTEIHTSRLHVGSDHLRIIVEARGTATASIETIPEIRILDRD